MDAYPELLRDLLKNRGIENVADAKKFLEPDYARDTHDPFLMKDMEKVTERIIRAINANEKILIYSDYDADGIPGAVILHDFFKIIGYNNFQNYIPLRQEEGFGLNKEAISLCAAEGAKLLITIDCGITDVEPVAHANELKIDVIITDHHEPSGEVPAAFAILNPKQADCQYPEKMLCGSGVMFKLIQAMLSKKSAISTIPAGEQIKEGWEKWLLDMVGLATLSDMVPLQGENRAFAFYGLKVLRMSPRIGLMKLIRKAGAMQQYITEDDIGFTITPRINAASRMGIPMDAFRLLSTKDEVEAGQLADHLDKKNNERKGLVAAMTRDINQRLQARMQNEALHEVIVMGHTDWKPSLLGLVANSLKDLHGRPVFLWGKESASVIKGSCRSDAVSVVELMEAARPLFITFGGHRLSGGFSIEQEKIHTLEEDLSAAYRKIIAAKPAGEKSGGTFAGKYAIDKTLSLADVSWNTWSIIERVGPFGTGNPKPMFLFENVLVESARQFGKEKNHLEIKLGEDKTVTAISFFSTPEKYARPPVVGERISLIAALEKSMFRNYPELRLRIIDIM